MSQVGSARFGPLATTASPVGGPRAFVLRVRFQFYTFYSNLFYYVAIIYYGLVFYVMI